MWITGLPGAGKTTLATALERELATRGLVGCVLDGDELRRGLSSDLGFTRADRAEQARRAAHLAVTLARSGIVAIVALVSPYAADRRLAREIHAGAGVDFVELWVDTPGSVCAERDPKGLYANSRAGRLHGLTGADAPYEPPAEDHIRVSGCDRPADVVADELVRRLLGDAPSETE